jgi:YVTN family beta-propeller protein
VQPAGIAMTPDRKVTVVANMGDDTVSVVRNRALAGTIRLPGSTHPYGIAISPDGTRAYVTSFVRFGGSLLVLDVNNLTVIANLPAGNFPAAVTLTPDGSQAWVTSVFEDMVTIFDTLTNTQATRITGITNAWGIQFHPNGTRAYVTDSALAGGGLFVIDATNYKLITRISTGNAPRSVAVTPTGRHVFVTNRGSDYISQIDARTNKLIRNIQVGSGMEGLQFVK